ncbi:maltose acetyltransferase domain-containing protein, partial [Enterococcus faecalis]|uniref:maltose acetyltransferase domain-containing protein n=1 Tax=Enterococcus faecalis TaxID=1351 RepID=UPI003D69FF46
MEEFKSEKEKMIPGALYFASEPELVADRKKAREQMALIYQQPGTYIRRQLIEETFGKVGGGTYIEPMIQFD